LLLSQAIARYCNEMEGSGVWGKAAAQDYRGDFKQLVQIAGDAAITSVNKAVLFAVKETLLMLPADMNKRPELRGKGIPAILALRIPPQSPVTVRKKWTRFTGLFEWAKNHGLIADNPALGMRPKAESQSYEKFSASDLAKLFSGARDRPGALQEPFQYWVPVIGAFTGARIEEICQLHVADIREEQSVLCFFFTTDIDEQGDLNEPKHLKTQASNRLCPVHPKLFDLGLIDFIVASRHLGHARLFPELHRTANGKLGPRASEWFTSYRRECGVGSLQGRSRKVFHSFRHTMNATLQRASVPQEVREQLCGHRHAGVNTSIYGDRLPVRLLLSHMCKLDYGNIFTPYESIRSDCADLRTPPIRCASGT